MLISVRNLFRSFSSIFVGLFRFFLPLLCRLNRPLIHQRSAHDRQITKRFFVASRINLQFDLIFQTFTFIFELFLVLFCSLSQTLSLSFFCSLIFKIHSDFYPDLHLFAVRSPLYHQSFCALPKPFLRLRLLFTFGRISASAFKPLFNRGDLNLLFDSFCECENTCFVLSRFFSALFSPSISFLISCEIRIIVLILYRHFLIFFRKETALCRCTFEFVVNGSDSLRLSFFTFSFIPFFIRLLDTFHVICSVVVSN